MIVRGTFLWMTLGFMGASILFSKETVKSPLEVMGRQATAIEEKRIPLKQWSSGESLPLTEKRIPLEAWSKHFSSLGNKRAPIAMTSKEQATVPVVRKQYPKQKRPMSRMNRSMARIERESRIRTLDKPLVLKEAQVYAMMLQGAVFEEEMSQQLSLRDLNRFQFRRNRSDAPVPVKQAGGGER